MNISTQAKAPGDLDPTFGESGVLRLPVGFHPVAAQLGDGRLLFSGNLENQVALLCLHADGTPDDAFGENGVKRIHTLRGGEESVTKMALFPDDSLVLLGAVGSTQSYLLRTLPNGELDSSFGDAGHSLLTLPGGANSAWSLNAQADGKVLMVVKVSPDQDTSHTWLVRLAEGRPDPAFGDNGSGMQYIGINHDIGDLAILPDGRLIMAGTLDDALLFVQCLGDGQLDPSFGENGMVVTAIEQANNLLMDQVLPLPDGRIAAVGSVVLSDYNARTLTTRILANGTLDSSFNGGEPFIAGFEDFASQNTAVIRQQDGKLVTGGYTAGSAETSNLLLRRFNPITGLDLSFGSEGQVITELGGFELLNQLLLQEDGRILAVGRSLQASSFTLLARYLP